jgi:hypothetical protein
VLEFLRQWGDKFLMCVLFLTCLFLAVYAFDIKDPDLQSTTVDLAKQILAGLLTLLVAHRVSQPNGGTNGKTSNGNTIPSVDPNTSGVRGPTQ